MQWPFRDQSRADNTGVQLDQGPSRAPWWPYACTAAFLALALWIYVVNTRSIRSMAVAKERLRSRVGTVCALLQAGGDYSDHSAWLASAMDRLEEAERGGGHSGDEYLFIMDKDGSMWLNGGQPHLARSAQGTRPGLSLLQAEKGNDDKTNTVQQLLQKARQGGGFVSYPWHHPGTQETKTKTSYVQEVPATRMVVGCGTYA